MFKVDNKETRKTLYILLSSLLSTMLLGIIFIILTPNLVLPFPQNSFKSLH